MLDLVAAEMENYSFDDVAEVVAKTRGQVVVLPEPNEIQLDIDDAHSASVFNKRIKELAVFVSCGHIKYFDSAKITKSISSKSGYPSKHIYISFFLNNKPIVLNEWQRIVLQFMLGSDVIRETLNGFRLLRGVENPTRLFEYAEDTKEKNKNA